MRNIILTGMPGCGKTTIGKLLSQALNVEFFDCDAVLEETENTTITKIFESFGEDYFRQLETKTLSQLCKKQNAVISTGGGVVERKENLDILKNSGIVVFINRPLELIFGDVDTSHRPLLKDGKERLTDLYNRRIALYKSACDIEIENSADLAAVVEKIIDEVKKNG